MQYLKTLINDLLRNAILYPRTTAKGFVIALSMLGIFGAGFTLESQASQDMLNGITLILGAIGSQVLGAQAKD